MGIMGITMTELNVHLGSFRTGPADLSAQSTGRHMSPKAQRPQKKIWLLIKGVPSLFACLLSS
jgi:hypothetical protein